MCPRVVKKKTGNGNENTYYHSFFFGRDFWTSTIVVAYVYMYYGNATVFFKIPCKCNVKLDQTLLFKSLGTVGFL